MLARVVFNLYKCHWLIKNIAEFLLHSWFMEFNQESNSNFENCEAGSGLKKFRNRVKSFQTTAVFIFLIGWIWMLNQKIPQLFSWFPELWHDTVAAWYFTCIFCMKMSYFCKTMWLLITNSSSIKMPVVKMMNLFTNIDFLTHILIVIGANNINCHLLSYLIFCPNNCGYLKARRHILLTRL